MRTLLLALAVLGLPIAAQAQDEPAESAQRARIAAERGQAEAAFRAQEKACYAKFAVNDCLKAAKAHRRQVLADLRRQEISLNDAQRKRRAAEQLRAVEERSSPEKQQQAQQRANAQAGQQDRESAAARKAADRAASEAAAPAKAAARQEQAARRQAEASAARGERDAQAAQNVKRQEERLAAAKERRTTLDKRLAERKKPAAKPLPVPDSQ